MNHLIRLYTFINAHDYTLINERGNVVFLSQHNLHLIVFSFMSASLNDINSFLDLCSLQLKGMKCCRLLNC